MKVLKYTAGGDIAIIVCGHKDGADGEKICGVTKSHLGDDRCSRRCQTFHLHYARGKDKL